MAAPSVPITRVVRGAVPKGPAFTQWVWNQGRAGVPVAEARSLGGVRGTDAHARLRVLHHASGQLEEPPPPSAAVAAVDSWWRSERPRITRLEVEVRSRRGFHGRLDYLRWCHGCESCGFAPGDDPLEGPPFPGIVVGDLKFGARARVFADAHLQCAAYVLALRDDGVEAVCGGEIVALAHDGEFRVVPCEAEPEDFLAVLASYRVLERLGGLG